MNIPRELRSNWFGLDGASVDGAKLMLHIATDLSLAFAYLLLVFSIVHLSRNKRVAIYLPGATYWLIFLAVILLSVGTSVIALYAPGSSLHVAAKLFAAACIVLVMFAVLRLLPRRLDPYEQQKLRLENLDLKEANRVRRVLQTRLEQGRKDLEVKVAEETRRISHKADAMEKSLIEARLEHERTSEAKRRLDELILRTNTAHVFLALNGVILDANFALAQMLGRANASELIGRALPPLLGHTRNDKVGHFINEVVRNDSFTLELDIQPPARGLATIELSGAATVRGDEPCVMALVRDVSDRRAAELKLLEERDALTETVEATRKANAKRSDFLAKMNHELRTPLNGIIGLSEIIRYKAQGKTMSGVEARKLANNIHQSGRHLLSLVDDLLGLTRLDVGTREFTPVNLRVHEEVEAALATLGAIADKRRITLRNSCPKGLEWALDQRAFKQVVINLVDNAIKFSPPDAQVDVSVTHTADTLSLHVRDEGPGIADADREKIMSPFGRGEYAETHNIDGVGLGLTIVSELLKLQGGHIEIESRPGQGSTFIAVFPQAVQSAPEARAV